MKRVAVFGSMAQFESFVNDPNVSIIDVKVDSCKQSSTFQECFIGVVFYEDAPLKSAESPATDRQQLKAEITAVRKYIEDMREAKMSSESILNHVDGTLRQLSAV